MYDWKEVLEYSFQSVWAEVVSFLPQLVTAVVVLIIGWIIGSTLKKIIKNVFAKLNVDKALDAAGVDMLTQKAGYKLNSGAFVGTLVKWFVIVVFFVATLDILNLQQATAFLSDVVLGYLPQVIVAVLIIFGGVIVASFTQKVVVAGGRATSFASAEFLGKFAYFAILAFTALATLNQLAIAPELVQMLFAGLVFGLSLAFGLAFGLGGRGAAARYLDRMSSHNDSQHRQ